MSCIVSLEGILKDYILSISKKKRELKGDALTLIVNIFYLKGLKTFNSLLY